MWIRNSACAIFYTKLGVSLSSWDRLQTYHDTDQDKEVTDDEWMKKNLGGTLGSGLGQVNGLQLYEIQWICSHLLEFLWEIRLQMPAILTLWCHKLSLAQAVVSITNTVTLTHIVCYLVKNLLILVERSLVNAHWASLTSVLAGTCLWKPTNCTLGDQYGASISSDCK